MSGSYQCPHCGKVSREPNDLANQYCGACHHFADDILTLDDVRLAADRIADLKAEAAGIREIQAELGRQLGELALRTSAAQDQANRVISTVVRANAASVSVVASVMGMTPDALERRMNRWRNDQNTRSKAR